MSLNMDKMVRLLLLMLLIAAFECSAEEQAESKLEDVDTKSTELKTFPGFPPLPLNDILTDLVQKFQPCE